MNQKFLKFVCIIALILLFSLNVSAQSLLQWAIDADGSSQYQTTSYSFKQLLGLPDVFPSSGNNTRSWCPLKENAGFEWIELSYEQMVVVEEIVIYETYNPGAITKVELRDQSGRLHQVWTGIAQPISDKSRAFKIALSNNQIAAKQVRISLNTSSVPGWNEIDAVSISGRQVAGTQLGTGFYDHYAQWVKTATGSSQYDKTNYSFSQLLGEPNVYPQYGDDQKAWCPKEKDGLEWLELFYDQAVYVDVINVYETYNPGAVVKVELLDANGLKHVIWEGLSKPEPSKARIFTVRNNIVRVPVKRIILTLDTTKVSGWNEIDAVQLVGWRNSTQVETASKGGLSLEEQLYHLLEKGRREGLADQDFLNELESLLDALFN